MKITLWGDQATGFNIDNVYDATAGNLIVCLIVGCSAREDFKNNGTTFSKITPNITKYIYQCFSSNAITCSNCRQNMFDWNLSLHLLL